MLFKGAGSNVPEITGGMVLFSYKVQKPEEILSMRPDGVLITSLTDTERLFEGLKKQIDINKIRVERL